MTHHTRCIVEVACDSKSNSSGGGFRVNRCKLPGLRIVLCERQIMNDALSSIFNVCYILITFFKKSFETDHREFTTFCVSPFS